MTVLAVTRHEPEPGAYSLTVTRAGANTGEYVIPHVSSATVIVETDEERFRLQLVGELADPDRELSAGLWACVLVAEGDPGAEDLEAWIAANTPAERAGHALEAVRAALNGG